MSLIEMINAGSVLITAIATFGLAVITAMYLMETKKIREESERYRKTFIDETEKSRVEAKKPILSFQSDDDPTSRWHGLYICNYGPIARHLAITVTSSIQTRPNSPLFLYTLSQRERINISADWTSVREAGGAINVDVIFHDADMRRYEEHMTVAYNEIPTQATIAVPVLQPVRVDCYHMR
jgi:hypothetical protein